MAETTETPVPTTNPNVTPLPVYVENPALEITSSCDLPVTVTNCSLFVDFANDAMVAVKPEDSSVPETQAVGTTVLIVLGAEDWTQLDPGTYMFRYVEITNCNGAPVFVRPVAYETSEDLPIVSPTDYVDKLYAGDRAIYAVSPMQQIQIVRESGTGNVCARRHVR